MNVGWGAYQAGDTIAYPAGATSFSITHQYVDDATVQFGGTYDITITVTTSDGRPPATANTTIEGVDVAPTANIAGGPNGQIEAGDPVNLSAVVADPGENGIFTYSWTATGGDDSFAGNLTAFSFTPTNDDDHTVTLRVTDPDGKTVTKSVTIPGAPAGGTSGTRFSLRQPDTPTVTIEDTIRMNRDRGSEAISWVSVSGNMPDQGTVTVFYNTENGTDYAGSD